VEGLCVVVAAALATTVRLKADTTDVAGSMYVVSGFSRTAQLPFDQATRTSLACGDAAALPIVEPMMRDPDPKVARAAARAVARLRAASRLAP
jgi:hypothetical protein